MSYLTYEREDPEHTERYGEEEQQEEVRWCQGCSKYLTKEEECEHDAALKRKSEMKTLICSCGSKLCSAIGLYGLPEPTFHESIEPIPTQYQRDVRAREMKLGGTNGGN